ncbi:MULTISPECIES: DNA polymerase III subunit chi [Euryhalocaulis]|uniref:DNA polymerase III subunit chi n=1 Tax=Euryhalocaulis TaxID=1712422 RepID=UPI0003A9EC83|nr:MULTISPECIES: DNA polymerase III subunit chi [Euryhalocaulis]MBA4800247.1 DNA polymerase III subunit chi [Euryhalocaulis sp.]
MGEVWFYHLERASLNETLPSLLEKTLQKGWRALVRVGSQERLDSLDGLLWTYRDESFLPHGRFDSEDAERQPILLTLDADNANSAQILFLTDPSAAFDVEQFERVALVFDGNDQDSVAAARERWKEARSKDAAVSYWRQSEDGRWTKAG